MLINDNGKIIKSKVPEHFKAYACNLLCKLFRFLPKKRVITHRFQLSTERG